MHQRNADCAFNPDLELRQLERRSHDLLDSLGRLQRIFNSAAQRDEHSKFIAAGPREHVACAQRKDQAPSKGDQQLVAGKAPHRLVDPAETKHVDHEHGMLEVARDLLARPARSLR